MVSLDQLLKEGFKYNPHLWIGNGFLYCKNCREYGHHTAYSKKIGQFREDSRLVCDFCLQAENK